MKKIRTYFAIVALISLPFFCVADNPGPPPPPGGGGPGGGGTPVGAPIDGGIGILLALGLGYGGMKLFQSRKDKDINSEMDKIEE
ncbi:MAG: hypothetical protein NT004_02545 [Bacteroidetes bacterium]|nr:hypothetical protein [Bacteroidota bacterium]